MKELIKSTILLTVTCLVAAGLLAAVYGVTKPKIDENKVRKEIDALCQMVPEPKVWVGVSKDGVEILRANEGVTDGLTVDGVETWIGRSEDGREICRIVKSSARGYSSTIKMLVAVGPDGSCQAVTVLEQSETPGLGVNVTSEKFLTQFKGKTLNEMNLTKDGGKIDAITGATISSKAAVKAAREGMEGGCKQ